MYNKILLLMDCSGVDQVIIEHIRELALIHESSVQLFHVVHAHTLDQRRALESNALNCLKAAAARLTEAGIDASYSLAEGEPAEEILKLIGSAEYDLVALATHGHGVVSDLLLGSVSRTIKHAVDLPLLFIRGGQ